MDENVPSSWICANLPSDILPFTSFSTSCSISPPLQSINTINVCVCWSLIITIHWPLSVSHLIRHHRCCHNIVGNYYWQASHIIITLKPTSSIQTKYDNFHQNLFRNLVGFSFVFCCAFAEFAQIEPKTWLLVENNEIAQTFFLYIRSAPVMCKEVSVIIVWQWTVIIAVQFAVCQQCWWNNLLVNINTNETPSSL